MVETLVREPVKEAVREAMSEAELDRPGEGGRSSKRSRRLGRSRLLLPLAGLVAAVLYWRRRSADRRDIPGPGTGTTGPARTTESGTRTGPDTPAGSGRDEPTEERADEEATTSS